MKKSIFALLVLFNFSYSETGRFYGDDISSYKGDYYNDETFWGKIFVENPARCDDEKAGGEYLRFSDAKERILHYYEHTYKIFDLWSEDAYGGRSIVLLTIDIKKYKQGDDLEYIKHQMIDERIGLFINKDGKITISTINDNTLDVGDTPTYLYVCPTK